MLCRHTRERRRHADRRAVGLEHEQSALREPRIGFAHDVRGFADALTHSIDRWNGAVLRGDLVDRKLHSNVEFTHLDDSSSKSAKTLAFQLTLASVRTPMILSVSSDRLAAQRVLIADLNNVCCS